MKKVITITVIVGDVHTDLDKMNPHDIERAVREGCVEVRLPNGSIFLSPRDDDVAVSVLEIFPYRTGG